MRQNVGVAWPNKSFVTCSNFATNHAETDYDQICTSSFFLVKKSFFTSDFVVIEQLSSYGPIMWSCKSRDWDGSAINS